MTAPRINSRLAKAVEGRRKELQLTPGEFAKQTGLSGPALLNLRRGKVRKYHDGLKIAVCRVLKWTPDSIDRLLDDRPPKVLDDQPDTAVPDISLESLSAVVTQLADRVEALAQQFDEFQRRGDR